MNGSLARTALRWLCLLSVLGTATTEAAVRYPRLEFTRMMAHWAHYSGPEYLELVDAAKPELVQFGFYGAHFWGLAHTPHYKGYPARLPVQGLDECGRWFEQKNKELHRRKILVIGHLNVEFLVGDPDGPEGPRGFFKFYDELWDESELGPKPTDDARSLLERNRDGSLRKTTAYQIGGMAEYWACLRNPDWRRVLKAWIKHGIGRGVDGFIANYFYRHDCHCKHCQTGFRDYLGKRHAPAELADKFGIKNLKSHVFDEIVTWHKPEESTPLRREMLRWSQLSNKEAFDEVFVKYGRSLKPDLIVAQWNHLSNFKQIGGDERCLLPGDVWGRDEDYLWYSLGASGVYTDLKNGVLADGTLQARYIRGAFDDKPFTLGKYEGVRIRTAIAELAANGGSPMGFYARTTDLDAREHFKTYYAFLGRYEQLYHANRSHAEVALRFPRKAIHAGNLEPLDRFREFGKRLLNQHVLFDVIPDDLLTPEIAGRYRAVLKPGDALPTGLSNIAAPPTVRVGSSRSAAGGEIDLHFVNYNRKELPPHKNGRPNPGRGAKDENPIPVSGIPVVFDVPADERVTAIEVVTPESPDPVAVEFIGKDRVTFTVPEFLVYSVARIKLAPRAPETHPRIAGITTIHRVNSHADVLLTRLVETESLNGEGRHPKLDLTALYTDQVPDSDISRHLAKKHGFVIKDSIAKTLRHGSLDGVMLVAEHGDYAKSDTGNTIYPKRRMFTELAEVFEKDGIDVPVFIDKHLADNWKDAKWLYDRAKELNIPLMAGSSVPGAWRVPATDVRRGAKLDEIVGVTYGSLDAYGFHALEMVQSLAERRAGGETGIKRVRCITGPDVWTSTLYDRELLKQTLDRLSIRRRLDRKPLPELVREPVLFHIEYNDGLRASLLQLNGAVAEWASAWRYASGETDATLFWLQEARPYHHFAHLLRGIEKMFHTGKPTWPVERTLLTSGTLDALLISRRDGGGWLATPYLNVEYRSDYNWTQPDPPLRGWRLPNPKRQQTK